MLDCFHLLLHFITSLIKPVLWLKFFERQAEDPGGGWGRVCPEKAPQGPALLLSLSLTLSFLPSTLPLFSLSPSFLPSSSFSSHLSLPSFFLAGLGESQTSSSRGHTFL